MTDLQGYEVNVGDYVLHDGPDSKDKKCKAYAVSRITRIGKNGVSVDYCHLYLEHPEDARTTSIKKFFRVNKEIFDAFNESIFWKWATRDPAEKKWYASKYVRPSELRGE